MTLAVADAVLRRSPRFQKLRDKLDELFELDRGDLDFGIYRIMNLRRDEVRDFLANDLLPQVRDALTRYRQEDAADIAALEETVYGHLHTFFSRYYKDGDFLSLRRYKEGVYAIPYEGEEVKLYWANHDQYYIKSAENLRTYAFRTEDGRRVRFELAVAGTERDNVKALAGKERRFFLHAAGHDGGQDGGPVRETTDDGVAVLTILFEYRQPCTDREAGCRQDELTAQAVSGLRALPAVAGWSAALFAAAPTAGHPGRTVLEKHLAQYTARWTFDYFIHKNLGGFLRRELDFYIKNEVMHLDDIDQATVTVAERQLSTIRAIRRVALKIIEFLAHLEDAQKALWLKKKFVLESHWCLTLDRIFAVRERAASQAGDAAGVAGATGKGGQARAAAERDDIDRLLAEIAGCDAQRKEWVKLFAIDRIKSDLAGSVGYAEPLSIDFLRANPFLVLDTRWFSPDFKDRVLALFDDLDGQTDGLLVHGENFGALNLLMERYRATVQTIYADPPYNTDADPINYKNGYKSSTWLSMLYDRIKLSRSFLTASGVACMTIDDFQYKELAFISSDIFSEGGLAATVPIRSNPSGRPTPTGFGQAHEYAIFLQNSDVSQVGKLARSEKQARRYKEQDEGGKAYMWELFRKRGSGSERRDRPTLYYPIYAKGSSVRIPDMQWNESDRTWQLLEEPASGEVAVFPCDENGVDRRWRGKPQSVRDEPERFEARVGPGGLLTIYYKYSPGNEVMPTTMWIDSKYSATEHGTGVLKHMFKDYSVFSFPKSIHAVEDCLQVAGLQDDGAVCLDYFGGSGTTAHAIIRMNREDEGRRKYILIEVEKHFDNALKPRISKAIYANEWDSGIPTSRKGISHAFKYIRIESYEDTLDNLDIRRSPERQDLLDRQPALREGYMLRYLLDPRHGDIAGSPSLLNLDAFAEPFRYTLRITRDDETREAVVDLPETFNCLTGLRVATRQRVRGVLAIAGTLPNGDKALVLWRSLSETPNEALDAWFRTSRYSTQDTEFDVIWVNGDNNLENLRASGPADMAGDTDGNAGGGGATWKVRLIEQDFKRLMFDVRDV
jgi:adenine-specific DNA-methyltransferase